MKDDEELPLVKALKGTIAVIEREKELSESDEVPDAPESDWVKVLRQSREDYNSRQSRRSDDD